MNNSVDRDEDPAREQDRGLAQRAEVLRAAVAVGMLGIGRTAAQPHREERQRGGDDIAAGLDPARDQAQAPGEHANAELQRDQQCRGGDGDERRTPLREHVVLLARLRHR